MTNLEAIAIIGFALVVWGLVAANGQLAKMRNILMDINTKVDGLGSPASDDDVSTAAERIVKAIKENLSLLS